MATLLLTRPEERSRMFLAECEALVGHSLPAVISPVFKIEATGAKPDLDQYQTLIFTSSNAVKQVEGNLAGRSVVTVGERTAELARALGARASMLGVDLKTFLENSGQIKSPALHCRGVHTHGDLAASLTNLGVKTEEAVLYDQAAKPLSAEANSLLLSEKPVVAPLFSARSAQLLSENQMSANVTAIAISPAVAEAWTGLGEVVIAQAPDSASMAKRVGAYI